jgi:acylpyruvate hydrolase
LGNSIPTTPFYFFKPPSSYLLQPGPILLPKGATVHHEVEMGVVIGQTANNISQLEAESVISGYVLGIDLTARNYQEEAKKKGMPWTLAKGFATFTPIGKFINKSVVKDAHNLRVWLNVDGQIKQDGNTSDMIFSVPQLIEYVSSVMTLSPGDVILTGTPAGVGPIHAGNTVTAGMEQDGHVLDTITFKVEDRVGGLYGH